MRSRQGRTRLRNEGDRCCAYDSSFQEASLHPPPTPPPPPQKKERVKNTVLKNVTKVETN